MWQRRGLHAATLCSWVSGSAQVAGENLVVHTMGFCLALKALRALIRGHSLPHTVGKLGGREAPGSGRPQMTA